eukprot:COSAG02_NODE_323_length_24725_cov_57.558272_7_plen_149_part_00
MIMCTQQNGTTFQCRLRKIVKKTTPALDFAEMRIDLASENQRRSSGVPVVGAAALGKMIIPVRCFTCGKVSSRGWELLGRAGAVGWGGEGRGGGSLSVRGFLWCGRLRGRPFARLPLPVARGTNSPGRARCRWWVTSGSSTCGCCRPR